MGYCGLDHIGGSDEAADAASHVMDVMVKQMKQELKLKTNEFNTDGDVNVALMFCDMIVPCQKRKFGEPYVYHSGLRELAERVVKKLDTRIARESTIDWGKSDRETESKTMHMRAYRRMRKQVQGYIDGSDV